MTNSNVRILVRFAKILVDLLRKCKGSQSLSSKNFILFVRDRLGSHPDWYKARHFGLGVMDRLYE